MYALGSTEIMAHGIEIVCFFVTAIAAVMSYLLTMRY